MGLVLVIDTSAARRCLRLLESHLLFLGSVMNTLFKDWLGLVDLKLGLKLLQVMGDARVADIGVTASNEIELRVVENFDTSVAPVGSDVSTW